MTEDQLKQTKQFALSFYEKADQFHNKHHAELTTKYALLLAKEYPETDLKILEAACYLHDIGRIHTDEGHAYESAKLAKPFLEKIHLSSKETENIIHTVYVHGIKDIHTAKTIEAKLLFDADKMQQLSVYGFLRMVFFTIAIQKKDMSKTIESWWNRVQEVWNYMQTEKAKELLAPEMKKIKQIVLDFRKGLRGELQ